MKLIGMNRPKKNRNDDAITKRTLVSLKGSTKTFSLNGRGFGGSRDVMVRFAIINRPRIRKAIDLKAHAKPTSGIRWVAMIG